MTASVPLQPENRSNQKKAIWSAAALVGLVFLAHGPALWGAFIWDDYGLITQNVLIRQSSGLWQFWFTTRPPDYFPLTSSTWWIEWRIWGEHPAGYHLVNLLLHAVSAVFIWRILLELAVPGAWLGAAIWAVHPVQVESVAWIAERKNTLCLALAAASFWLLLRYFCSNTRRTYIWALVLFAAAMLAKTAVAPLPLVMAICAIALGRNLRRAVLDTLPFFATSVALSAVTIFFQAERSIGKDVIRTDGLASRIAIAGRAVWFYLDKLIWPTPLSFVYPRWETGHVSLQAFVPLLVLGLALILLWLGRRRWGRGPLLAMAYFVLLLLPVLGLINIYFMRYSLVADHWQYVASVGPIALIGAAIFRAGRIIRWAVGSLIIVSLVVLSERQSNLYRSGEALWSDAIAKNPSGWMPQISLGQVLAAQRRYQEAEAHYRIAATLAPDLPEPLFSIGSAEAAMGRYAAAVADFDKAIQLNPHLAPIHREKARCLVKMNQLDAAQHSFETAIACDPSDPAIQFQLGVLLEQMHKPQDATKAYESAVALDPDFAVAQVSLADLLLAKHELPEAVEHLRAAVAAAPDWAQPHAQLGHALQLQGDREEAAAELAKAFQLNQNPPDMPGSSESAPSQP
jgi:tetratricopeptide (TPR) repeat protein